MRNLKANKKIWILTTVLALISATVGIFSPEIYTKVVAESLIPGLRAQDLLTVVISIALLGLIVRIKENEVKKQIVILGIIASMGYLYTIFSIERAYTIIYLFYLAILGLNLYGLPYSIASLNKEEKWKLNLGARMAGVGFSVLIATLFIFLWVSSLIPVIKSGQKVEVYYSIYILDLAWVMPGFLITAWLSFKKKAVGLLLTPAMYILGIFVIFPLGLGELAKPFYGMPIKTQDMIMSFGLSGAFLVMAIWQLVSLKREN